MSNNQTDLLLTQFQPGDRVRLDGGLDRAVRGDRFGEVARIGYKYVHVRLDRSGDTRPFVPERLTRVGLSFVRTVACPLCGAAPGQPCKMIGPTAAGSNSIVHHAARYRAVAECNTEEQGK